MGRWSKAAVFHIHLLWQWWEALEVMGAKALFLHILHTCVLLGDFLHFVLILSLLLSTNALESSQTPGFCVWGFINTEIPDPSNEQVNKNTQYYPRLADQGSFRKAAWPRSEENNHRTGKIWVVSLWTVIASGRDIWKSPRKTGNQILVSHLQIWQPLYCSPLWNWENDAWSTYHMNVLED